MLVSRYRELIWNGIKDRREDDGGEKTGRERIKKVDPAVELESPQPPVGCGISVEVRSHTLGKSCGGAASTYLLLP
jgi:hypothetical protein